MSAIGGSVHSKKRSKNHSKRKVKKRFQDEGNKAKKVEKESKCLTVDEGFVWNERESIKEQKDEESSSDQSQSEASDGSEQKLVKKRKSRKVRNEEAKQREEYLRSREKLLLDSNRAPETEDDFERLVISSPNSSIVWIHYMSFYLDEGAIEKARNIAERALITISFREEKEKLNVWIALLNLENTYGNEESLNACFTRALQQNDQLTIYNHMIKIYEQSDKLKSAEQLYDVMLRKFKKEKSVWINLGVFHMKHNNEKSARKVLERSLLSLEKREHIDIISKFAQLEFQFGDYERGRTMFENLLNTYPKRVDIWSIYVDMMIKYAPTNSLDTLASIREVFERMITLKLPVKKMRTLFKKYLDFESKYGNEDTFARVKQKAKDYVESNPFASMVDNKV
ncbi:Pdcd11 protein-like protein [Dinothrombium tinctorium]|uniref:Pdcd11 protein-like protein n=1 Tax=Dinothrombium tinctorium TaxID=1965070 RepID=A0A3S3P7I2_9ACAR|nr:Pdcd11 protein-like protein [Dinothrombium tinctorium]RWS01692.1 Pdcd11 protein-like protein [Dinothrombium tinctorium]RWS09593.1 Pdcd11 protein-like protein [Dinothrombium tinctorium]